MFTWSDPKKIARVLKGRQSAASAGKAQSPVTLNFHVNRGGKNVTAQKAVLNRAKEELREIHGRN